MTIYVHFEVECIGQLVLHRNFGGRFDSSLNLSQHAGHDDITIIINLLANCLSRRGSRPLNSPRSNEANRQKVLFLRAIVGAGHGTALEVVRSGSECGGWW